MKNNSFKKPKKLAHFWAICQKVTKNLDTSGIKLIVLNYELFFIDIWGVVHNGISLFNDSIKVLNEIEKLNKEYVLLTNAPRPNFSVRKFLEKMGMQKKISEKVYTSGQASLDYLITNFKDKGFYHIGPSRDFDLFNSFKKNKISEINDSEYLLCTGLYEKQDQNLNTYKELLGNQIDKRMVCTNPDLVVDRGKIREYCAGSIAKIFEDLGGKVDYFGKPYPNVYNLSTKIKNRKVLCIGDNLNTDIRGANIQNFSSLLISNGIHKEELINKNQNELFKEYNVSVDYIQKSLKW